MLCDSLWLIHYCYYSGQGTWQPPGALTRSLTKGMLCVPRLVYWSSSKIVHIKLCLCNGCCRLSQPIQFASVIMCQYCCLCRTWLACIQLKGVWNSWRCLGTSFLRVAFCWHLPLPLGKHCWANVTWLSIPSLSSSVPHLSHILSSHDHSDYPKLLSWSLIQLGWSYSPSRDDHFAVCYILHHSCGFHDHCNDSNFMCLCQGLIMILCMIRPLQLPVLLYDKGCFLNGQNVVVRSTKSL